LPRSITNVARAFGSLTATEGVGCGCETRTESEGFAARAIVAGISLLPRPSPPFACTFCRSPDLPASQSAAPHSSQYREPARFFVPHLSQVIIEIFAPALRFDINRSPRENISYRERLSRTTASCRIQPAGQTTEYSASDPGKLRRCPGF
jgi:hypothetical protein